MGAGVLGCNCVVMWVFVSECRLYGYLDVCLILAWCKCVHACFVWVCVCVWVYV